MLVTHLSKEIEIANTQLVEQRTKNNLFVAFGPFLLLGGLASNAAALETLRHANPCHLTLVAILSVAAYSCLGMIAARVEQQIWNRANHCRQLLAEQTGLSRNDLVFSTDGLFALYALIFGALGVVFVGLGYILWAFK